MASSASAPAEAKLLTEREVMAQYRFGRLRQWRYKGRDVPPSFVVNGRRLYRPAEVEQWLEKHRASPPASLAAVTNDVGA